MYDLFTAKINVYNYLWILVLIFLDFYITQIIIPTIGTIRFAPNRVQVCISTHKRKIHVPDFEIKTFRTRKAIIELPQIFRHSYTKLRFCLHHNIRYLEKLLGFMTKSQIHFHYVYSYHRNSACHLF